MSFCPACGAPLPHAPPVTCAACGTEHWPNAKPCAGVLVSNVDGSLLLVRRAHEPWSGRWDIPGGFCDGDEHPELTAVREVHEETGLEVVLTGFLGMWLDRYPPRWEGAPEDTTLNLYFTGTVAGGAEAPEPGEVSEIGWFGPDDLPAGADLAFPHHAAPVLAAWRESARR